MLSKKRKQSNTNENTDSLLNLTNNDKTERVIFNGNGSGTAMSVNDVDLLQRTDDVDLMLQAQMDTPFCNICREYEIRPKMAKYLPQLHKFEIVCICDDSGSMNTPVDNTERTRWNELCSIMKIIVKISVIFDSNGVDIYFLNRDPVRHVTDPKMVEEIFKIRPSGYTPLVPILKELFESPMARPGADKKLLVFIATDGQPTDEKNNTNVSQLEDLMRKKRQIDTTYVSFLVCTDDTACVDYLNKWDTTMPNVDVTDDFRTERGKIRKCQKQSNYPFSFGDYIVKALVGAIVPGIDLINEEQ